MKLLLILYSLRDDPYKLWQYLKEKSIFLVSLEISDCSRMFHAILYIILHMVPDNDLLFHITYKIFHFVIIYIYILSYQQLNNGQHC